MERFMAEAVRKKTAKMATGKKRGRPRKIQDPLLVAKAPKKRGRPKKVDSPTVSQEELFRPTVSTKPVETPTSTIDPKSKNAFERNFGEGTAFDLDYGKLLIIALCIYIAAQVS